MSGVLNEVFVSGLPGLVGLSVHSHWSLSFLYARALICRSCAYGDRCFLFPECFRYVSSFSFLQFITENSVTILREPYFYNWYKFLVSALSSLVNGMLHYQYNVIALTLIIYSNMVRFCLQTPEVYLEINLF